MKIKKSKKFQDAYVITDVEMITEHSSVLYRDNCRHFIIPDHKEKNDIISVPYVFYSRHYRKWYEDTAFFKKDVFERILSKINS